MRVPNSKITVPRPPGELVPRPGLRAHLDAADPHRLIVVSAPAGYGKTLLLADWAQHHPGRTAWVTVDAGDNVARRLWVAVRAALRACPAVPPRTRERLAEHLTTGPVDELVAVLDDLDEPVRL